MRCVMDRYIRSMRRLDQRSGILFHSADSGSTSWLGEYSDEIALPNSAVRPRKNAMLAESVAVVEEPPLAISACTAPTIRRILNRSASLDSDMCELVVDIEIKASVLRIPSAMRMPPAWTSHRVKMPTRNVHLQPSLGKRRPRPLRRLGENGLSRAWGHSADTNIQM